MSSTNRGAERIPKDAYQTPIWAVEALIPEFVWGQDPHIMEPCMGEGHITYMLILRGVAPKIDWCEISKGRDFLSEKISGRYDFVVTNPPFSLAQEFVSRSLQIANCTIMVLPLNYMGAQKRREWWRQNPWTALHVLSKRPSFTNGGHDSNEYGWFVWDSTGRQKRGVFWL